MTPLVIIGAGGFGRECHDIVVAMNEQEPQWDFLGFIADPEPDRDLMDRRGTRWIGTTKALRQHAGVSFIVGVGDPAVRERLAQDAERAGLLPGILIHPNASLGMDVAIGEGTVICSHSSITTNVRIGRHVNVDQNVAVGHDTSLSDYVRINPGATVAGGVTLSRSVLVGTNAAVIQNVRIGEATVVGAGAVVLNDVPSGVTVVGVPARRLR